MNTNYRRLSSDDGGQRVPVVGTRPSIVRVREATEIVERAFEQYRPPHVYYFNTGEQMLHHHTFYDSGNPTEQQPPKRSKLGPIGKFFTTVFTLIAVACMFVTALALLIGCSVLALNFMRAAVMSIYQ